MSDQYNVRNDLDGRHEARKAFCISLAAALLLIVILVQIHDSVPLWVPQVVVTLAGLVGISWFAGRRLDLFDKGIHQRQEAANAQLSATERGNLNGAFKEAVHMMSRGPAASVLAGQQWLHRIAGGDQPEAELSRALLCSHIVSGTGPVVEFNSGSGMDAESHVKTRQAALNLVFGSPGRKRYENCKDTADLSGGDWRGLEFRSLHVTNIIFRNGDFIGANIEDTHFDGSDLRETTWAGKVGGNARTSMVGVQLSGAHASSCTFENIVFREADMSTDGPRTEFIHCRFVNCDFDEAIWTGTKFDTPDFQACSNITYELCHDAILKSPSGLPSDVLAELKRKGVGGLQPDETSERDPT